MDDNDISAILPSKSDQEQHYLGVGTPGHRQEIESEPDYIYDSTLMPTVFFAKKSMKELLDDRTIAFQKNKLQMKKMDISRQQQDYRNKTQNSVIESIGDHFRECPSPLDSVSVVHIHDCEAVYSFFSSDSRYVPLCKKCNTSLYLLTRPPLVKVYCCNPTCKLKIVGEFMLKNWKRVSKTGMRIGAVSRGGQTSQSLEVREELVKKQREFSKRELESIKKTAEKIMEK